MVYLHTKISYATDSSSLSAVLLMPRFTLLWLPRSWRRRSMSEFFIFSKREKCCSTKHQNLGNYSVPWTNPIATWIRACVAISDHVKFTQSRSSIVPFSVDRRGQWTKLGLCVWTHESKWNPFTFVRRTPLGGRHDENLYLPDGPKRAMWCYYNILLSEKE